MTSDLSQKRVKATGVLKFRKGLYLDEVPIAQRALETVGNSDSTT